MVTSKYKYFISSFIVLFLYGCGASLVLVNPVRQTFQNYKIGEQKQVAIGESIVEVERATVRDAYEAQFDYQTPTTGLLAIQHIYIHKGDRFTVVAKGSGESDELFIREEGPEKKNIFISITSDGHIKNGWHNSSGAYPIQGSWTKDQLFIKSDVPSKGENSFKSQIIYSGVSGNTLKVSYREFADDYARPAFSQDLQYNLDESKVIAYKSIRIEVIKAGNTMIDYKVIADGGLQWLPK